MHLYVDIGDASSSLWGSTSSLNRNNIGCNLNRNNIGCNLNRNNIGCNLNRNNIRCNLNTNKIGCNLNRNNIGCNLNRNNIWCNYAFPSSGEAYRDRQLTTNFELWVEIFCVPTCFHMRIPKPCLSVWSVYPYPEKKSIQINQYQFYTGNWYVAT